MGQFARSNERDERRYYTRVKPEHDRVVRNAETEKRERRVKHQRQAAARKRVDERLARQRAARSGASFAAVPEGILGGAIIAIVAVITGAKPVLLVAAAAVAVVLTLVHCVLTARRLATVSVSHEENPERK